MRTSPRLLVPVLLLLAACGGTDETPPPADEVPVEAPDQPASKLPTLECPEGAVYAETETNGTFEQSCDIGGAKTGPFRRWYDADTKAVDGSYNLGMPDATWIWSYEDGTKKSKGSYRRGKQIGSWTWWYLGGVKSEEGDFLSGRKAGHWIRWYESGKIMEEGLYHNGTKNGDWKYYRDDETNTVRAKENWQMGKMKEEKYLDVAGKEIPKPPDAEDPS